MDSPKTGLMPFGERIQAALESETQPGEQLRAARFRLLEHVTGAPRRSPSVAARLLRYTEFSAIARFAVVAALVIAVVIMHVLSRPISFVTSAGSGRVGDVMEAVRHEPLRIEFSEGSRMLLRPGSRARVLSTQAAGARVLLESGAANVSIVHRTGRATHWRFEAGPFEVLVKGTQFELDWQPAGQLLLLTMKTGSVELSGSCLPAPRVVRSGSSLRLSCAKTQEPAVTVRAESAPTPGAARPQPEAPRTTAQAPARESKAAPQTFEASCETVGRAELVAWANRERLAGNVARARTALLALRRRFPGSSEAGTAAFTLGRVAFDQVADYGEAARWFSSYLAEQPNGPLMGDAAGRLLEAHERQGNRIAARHDAEAYLQRFPDGPYASRARRILAE